MPQKFVTQNNFREVFPAMLTEMAVCQTVGKNKEEKEWA
jgi:hypothetical protein